MVTTEKAEALVDCACPTTVSGKQWIENFFKDLDENNREKVSVEESERIYKFGGGEKCASLGKVVFPCHMAGNNIKLETEVVDADFLCFSETRC